MTLTQRAYELAALCGAPTHLRGEAAQKFVDEKARAMQAMVIESPKANEKCTLPLEHLAQSALRDYHQFFRHRRDATTEPYKKRCKQVIHALNSKLKIVQQCQQCRETATRVALPYENVRNNKTGYAYRDYSMTGAEIMCDSCHPTGEGLAEVLPLKFHSVLQAMEGWQADRKRLCKLIREAAGFKGPVTVKKANHFIYLMRNR